MKMKMKMTWRGKIISLCMRLEASGLRGSVKVEGG